MAAEAGTRSALSPRIGDEPVTFEHAYAAVLAYDREQFGPEREPLLRVRLGSVDPEWEIEREIAVEEAALAAQDIADQVVLDGNERAALAPDARAAQRIVAEAHRAADAYLIEHGWRPATLVQPRVRARRREPRSTRRRFRVRSGSRGDPPDEPAEPVAPRRAA
jgi:hypothetical protein